MKPFTHKIRDVDANLAALRCRPYGVIETSAGRLVHIELRPWPKIASVVEAKWISGWKNQYYPRDICRLYYNQPRRHRNYLTVAYIESTPQTRWRSVLKSMQLIDRIGFIKQSDAILAELSNDNISDRLMQRLGYERHHETDRHRHWIKRFYGEYPNHVPRDKFANDLQR